MRDPIADSEIRALIMSSLFGRRTKTNRKKKHLETPSNLLMNKVKRGQNYTSEGIINCTRTMHIVVYRQRANIQPGAHGQGASLQAAWAAASKKVKRGKLDRRKALVIIYI